MSKKHPMTRRRFLRTMNHAAVGAFALTAATPARCASAAMGPNERVCLAVIGCGSMGSRHIEALSVNPNCDLVALCDVAVPRYEAQAKIVETLAGKRPGCYQDFRRILERSDIDAILVATPDHWHPLLTILGCEAGKDVYVEKPVCTTVEEGRAMIDAARCNGRVVQVGTQQRSMPLFQQAIDVIHQGKIGQITSAHAWLDTNGPLAGENPRSIPKGIDWDLWLGPAPWVPFSPERFGAFRAFYDYARGGELANWGVHLIDIVHWGIRQDTPLSVQALDGNDPEGAGSDNYETLEAIIEYEGCMTTWEQRHSNMYGGGGCGVMFQGTEGRLVIDRDSFIIDLDKSGIHKVVGEPERSWANPPHHNNFFECIRTRNRPVAGIEQGVRSTTAILLPSIALKVGRKLYWDGKAERFIDDEQANGYLTKPYRSPWYL